jgi:hypothetical protein
MSLKMRPLWIFLPLALIATAQLRADTVTLTTGEKINGTIKNETDSEVVIDVPVSASITDERVIKKTDISKVDKERPDEIAYKQLIAVQPNPELSYASQAYDQILSSLKSFLTQYPSGPYVPEIKKLADTFQDEKKRVDAGEVKYEGRWLSKDEAARRQIQIVALQYYNQMQQEAAEGNLIGAMQTFDLIEKQYATTRIYPQAVTLAEEVLGRFQQDLMVRMQAVKADQDQLKQTVAFTAEPEKSQIVAAAKAEQDRAIAVIAEAVRNGAKWVPLIPRSQVSIDTLQKTAATEAGRLASIAVGPMNASVAKANAARIAIANGDYSGAGTLLKDSLTLWPADEAAHYWTERLQEKMATPTPTPKPSATPKPLPSARPTPEADVSQATPAPSENKPYYMTISGSITIAAAVLVIGGLIASINQKRRRKAAAGE